MNPATGSSDHEVLVYIVTGAVAIVIGLVWYLLREKDRKQGELIEKLFTLRDADSKELVALKIQIAENHYKKDELDAKFDKMEATNREEFGKLNGKMDLIIQTLMGKGNGG